MPKTVSALCFFTLIFFCHAGFAQPAADSLRALEYRDLAEFFLSQNCPDSSLRYQNLALAAFREQDDLTNWINTHKALGRIHRDEHKNGVLADAAFVNGLEEHLWRAPKDTAEWEALGWIYVHTGYNYAQILGHFPQARDAYDKAKSILYDRLGQEDLTVGSYVLRELANIYCRLGDYDAAMVLLEKFKSISLQEKDYNAAAEAYHDISIVLMSTDKVPAAIDNSRKALNLPGLFPETMGLLHAGLQRAHSLRGNANNALIHGRLAGQFYRRCVAGGSPSCKQALASVQAEIGAIQIEKGNLRDARKLLEESYELYKEVYAVQQRREFGKLFLNFGKLYYAWEEYEEALRWYQRALQSVLPGFRESDYRIQPNPVLFYAENTIMEALAGKAEAFQALHGKTKRIENLERALACYELIYPVESHLRRSYQYESSGLLNVAESRERSQQAIELALQLAKLSGNAAYKERAFEFAERSKSILLLEAYTQSRAQSLAGIPPRLLEEENELRTAVSEAEWALFKAQNEEQGAVAIQLAENELLAQRAAYYQWIKTLEENNPDYFELKYQTSVVSVPVLQNEWLAKDQALLEYFVGADRLFVFVITKTRYEALSLPLDFPLDDWVLQLRRDMEAFQLQGADRAALCRSYTERAQQLYQKLIKPVEDAVSLPQRLSIIPGEVLGLLPFEALLSANPAAACEFKNYPYLLKRYNISYGFSATLQAELTGRKRRSASGFLGVGPVFDGQGGFSALEHNLTMLEAIHAVMGGKLLLRDEATIENFRQRAGRYGKIHLATHAQANTAAGNFSFIVLADGAGGYDSLFVNDLYGLRLRAELVVLSACETGVGTVYKGEGVISLARGFLYAGAGSIITTLWSINDQANSLLMEQFYEEIRAGKPKDQALRDAKINRIENADALAAHPAYWAAFVPIGDMNVMDSTPGWVALSGIIAAGVGALGLLFFGWRRWKRRKNHG
jgi:CHAT domain-containing protein